jgi:general secretion pathway protein D
MGWVESKVQGWARDAALLSLSVLLLGCSNLEKTGSGTTIFEQIAGADLSARFPVPQAAPRGDGPQARSQIYLGNDSGDPTDPRSQQGPDAVEGAVPRDGNSFDLNFQNADVTAVAKVLLGDLLGLTYSVDPRVQGTFSLSSGRPVPKNNLLPLFESAVKLVNAQLVKEGSIYKVVPAGEAVGSGSTDRNGRRQLEPGYGISVLPLRYVSAKTILQAIDSFGAKPGAVRVDAARNLLLVQGASTERASTIEMALALDVDWMKNQSIGVFPVRNASPQTIIGELQNVFDAGKEGAAASLVRFQPIDRLNAVLAIAQTPSTINQVRTWIGRLDKADYSSTTVRVYRVRYGNAKQIATILGQIFTGQGGGGFAGGQLSADLSQLTPGAGARRGASGGSGFSLNPSQQQQQSQTSQSRGSSGFSNDSTNPSGDQQQSGIGGGGGGSSDTTRAPDTSPVTVGGGQPLLPNVRITADVANNSLLIYANRDQYKIIERAIFELDRAPLQVAIDCTIAEITLKNDLQYGLQYYIGSRSAGGQITLGTSAILSRVIPGFNAVLGKDADPRVVLSALRTITDVKVLSSPALVVLDNQQAQLQVGDEVPIATQSAQSVLTPGSPLVNTIEMRNTGVILKVTPRVNANGVVNLDVTQEISAVASTTPTLTPTISQRKVQSSIAVASGQTVLLGGLISTRDERDKSGVPILSELNRIGDLFAQNGGSADRTEIIIFIRPQIIRDGLDAQQVAEELRSKLSVMSRGAIDPGKRQGQQGLPGPSVGPPPAQR